MTGIRFTPEELAEHRADAEELMLAQLTAFAPTGRSEQNQANGRETPIFEMKGTTKGKLPGISRVALDARVVEIHIAGQMRADVVTSLHIPLSAFVIDGALQIQIGWEFRCDAVADGMDPAHVGRRWRVIGVPVKDYATSRRLDVEEGTRT